MVKRERGKGIWELAVSERGWVRYGPPTYTVASKGGSKTLFFGKFDLLLLQNCPFVCSKRICTLPYSIFLRKDPA